MALRGEQIDIGSNDKYIGVCYKCWLEYKRQAEEIERKERENKQKN